MKLAKSSKTKTSTKLSKLFYNLSTTSWNNYWAISLSSTYIKLCIELSGDGTRFTFAQAEKFIQQAYSENCNH